MVNLVKVLSTHSCVCVFLFVLIPQCLLIEQSCAVLLSVSCLFPGLQVNILITFIDFFVSNLQFHQLSVFIRVECSVNRKVHSEQMSFCQ